VNRKDLQALSVARIREARILFKAGEFSGAYYLAGYSVECALKACIAKKSKRHDFPEKKTVIDSYTHDLVKLATLADLHQPRLLLAQTDPLFGRNWDLVSRWSEEDRYRVFELSATKEIIDAIIERRHGVIPWVKRHW
jgi:HEPN domain-containing protein